MTLNGWLQIGLFLFAILLVTAPLGRLMTRVFNRERTWLDPVLRPIEHLIYRLTGVDDAREMRWTEYAVAMLLFSVVSMLVLYVMQRVQQWLPWNPQQFGAVAPNLAFNTAASFTTNTNWQAYGGESTMSYFTQMAGLAFHNFVSAAAGIAVAIAVIRGFVRRNAKTLGNFWVDLTRATLWVLLPLSVLGALVLVWQGVPDNFSAYIHVKTLDGVEQVIAQGPVASQEVIKELGTNGGGFFNANSAHPYENPTPLTNLLEMIAIFAIGAGLTHTFGVMAGNRRQGWALFAVMAILFLAGAAAAIASEQRGNPQLAAMGISQSASAKQSGGNMEGKEVRNGIVNSALWATITTDTSCGAVNSMHDSFLPIAGLVPLLNMMTDIVIFGGVGAGLYGILIYCIIAVFIAGLMVGRTPEYLGKKLEQKEVKMAMLAIIVTSASILVFSAISSQISFPAKGYWNPPGAGIANMNNSGPHGLSEILYAYTSSTGNN